MHTATYRKRSSELERYFDRTAADAWSKLTSDAKVSGIRATVRAGRDRMRGILLGWLPEDLGGRRVLDAGCGTGMAAVELARRGADVVAIDLSETLVTLARERAPEDLGTGRIDFRVGDMLAAELGRFDHVLAMDSFIHYLPHDKVTMIGRLAEKAERSMVFTFAPRTPLLSAMHAVGTLFPRGDRAPAIEPIGEARLRRLIAAEPLLGNWRVADTRRVNSGFYMSQGMELARR